MSSTPEPTITVGMTETVSYAITMTLSEFEAITAVEADVDSVRAYTENAGEDAFDIDLLDVVQQKFNCVDDREWEFTINNHEEKP